MALRVRLKQYMGYFPRCKKELHIILDCMKVQDFITKANMILYPPAWIMVQGSTFELQADGRPEADSEKMKPERLT